MKTLRIISLVAMCLFFAETAMAANYYVRGGATGTNNGSDWNNAYTSLPATLIRGSVYYIAGGNYPAHTFNDSNSGTATITIKKATVADHGGMETGWQDSYGTTQAVFNSIVTFNSGYYVFDGSTRNESDWFDGASYGIQVYHNNNDENVIIRASNITVKYVYVQAKYHDLPGTTVRQYAFDCEGAGSNLLFHRTYVYGSNNIWFLRGTNHTTVEYSASDGAASSSSNHGEIVNLYWTSSYHTSRYNIFRNAYTTGPGTALWAITTHSAASQASSNNSDYAEIYGNLVYNYCTTDGVIGYGSGDANHMRVYNNTFVDHGVKTGRTDCWGAGVDQSGGTDNLVYNNIWINWQSGRLSFGATHNYNAFSGSSNFSEANGQASLTTSIFTNYSGNDFRLTQGTSAGTSLSSPYNYDMLGNARGADGVWDRGAFQFGGNGSTVIRPNPPQGLVIQ